MKKAVWMLAFVVFAAGLFFVAGLSSADAQGTPVLFTTSSIESVKVKHNVVQRLAADPGAIELEFDFLGALILVTRTSPSTAIQSLDYYGGNFNGSLYLQMTDPNQSFQLKKNDFLRLKYDGGNNLKICLPEFNVVSGTSTQLWVDTNGNTYFNSALTDVARSCHK